jgi:hypothetical protein
VDGLSARSLTRISARQCCQDGSTAQCNQPSSLSDVLSEVGNLNAFTTTKDSLSKIKGEIDGAQAEEAPLRKEERIGPPVSRHRLNRPAPQVCAGVILREPKIFSGSCPEGYANARPRLRSIPLTFPVFFPIGWKKGGGSLLLE